MPNLDQLAGDGIRFDNHYTPSAICAPARMALYTGLFPVRNGGWPNHSECYEETRSIVNHLGDLGYRVGLHGKKHFGPPSVFAFEEVADVAGFIGRDPAQPYCLVVGTREPHAPWGKIIEDQYDPESLVLAPNLIDTPATRHALAKYYSDLTRLDERIGQCLRHVNESSDPENTIVIYTSDHGAQFPGGKWTCYEPGLRVPFVLRWPRQIAGGGATDALVQHVDVLPTLLELAGGEPSAVDAGRPRNDGERGFDGVSFASLLSGKTHRHRHLVYGVHTQHGTLRGTPYPVRSVRNERYKYIWNLRHEAEYTNVITGPVDAKHENAYWPDWLRAAENDKTASFLVERYLHRPEEEFYDLERDPWELYNRAEEPILAPVKEELRQNLRRWMQQQGDQGLATEMQALERQQP
jgi:uncharacterized sulfatase